MSNIFKCLVSTAFLCFATQVSAAPFSSNSYSADVIFQDALSTTTMAIAYDGTNYWSASGGSQFGIRYAGYDAVGNNVSTFSPGIDFRSVFTDSSNNVFARGYSSNTIYMQSAAGAFSPFVSLMGGTLDSQASVVKNSANQYVSMSGGQVGIWNNDGTFSNSFNLNGYTGTYPGDRKIATADDYLFTYSNTILSAWDYSGNLLGTANLIGAGTSFDSYFSFSYANDRIFVVDAPGSNWRGYNIGLSASGQVPEPSTVAILGLGLLGFAASHRKSAKSKNA